MMFHTKLITSKLHKNVLVAIAVACIAVSILLRKPIAQQMNNPIVKIFTIACIVAMTYLSPMIGCALAACCVYIITAYSVTEGFDGEEDDEEEAEEEDVEADEEDDIAD